MSRARIRCVMSGARPACQFDGPAETNKSVLGLTGGRGATWRCRVVDIRELLSQVDVDTQSGRHRQAKAILNTIKR